MSLSTFVTILMDQQLLSSIFIFLLLLKSSYQLSNDLLLFSGDVSLYEFLRQYCQTYRNRPQSILLLIDNLLDSNQKVNNTKTIKIHLQKENCNFDYQSNLNITQIETIYQLNPIEFHFKRILVIVDLNEHSLNHSILIIIYQLYEFYKNVHQLILITDNSFDHVHSVLIENYKNLSSEFRFTVWLRPIDRVIHFRPILYGCMEYHGIYVPSNSSEYDKLKVSYQKCNLQSTKLNVTINNVSYQ